MALQSMTALASITLQEATSSVSFSGIPQNYRDLSLTFEWGGTADSNSHIRFNSDSGTNYSTVNMEANGGVFSSSASGQVRIFIGFQTSTTRLFGTAQVMDYSATDKHKTVLIRQGNRLGGSSQVMATTGRWANTVEINSVQIFRDSGNFTAGSTFNLYGRIG